MENVNSLLIPLESIQDNSVSELNLLINNINISLIISRHGAEFRVYHNQCPHQGRRLDYAPGQFLSKNGHIVCAAHGASFALDSGFCVQGPCRGESLLAIASRCHTEHLELSIPEWFKTSDSRTLG